MIIKSKALRDSARGEDCTLRLDACNFDPETTVLAHIPCGQKGVGLKGPDTLACYACANCHDILDSRAHGVIEEGDLLRAIAETHERLIRKGILTIKGMK